MPFMVPDTDYFEMLVVETSSHSEHIPSDLVGPDPTAADLREYLEGDPVEPLEVERRTGWWARLSAPGYMDATDWDGPYETEADALAALAETYDLCPDCMGEHEDGPCDGADEDDALAGPIEGADDTEDDDESESE